MRSASFFRSLSAFRSLGGMLVGGGLALISKPINLCLTRIAISSQTSFRPSSTAAIIMGIGIFLGAGAKFRPFERIDFCGVVRSLEDRLTTPLSSIVWLSLFLSMASIFFFIRTLQLVDSLDILTCRNSQTVLKYSSSRDKFNCSFWKSMSRLRDSMLRTF